MRNAGRAAGGYKAFRADGKSKTLCAAAPKKTASSRKTSGAKPAAGTQKTGVQTFSVLLCGTAIPVTLTHRRGMKRMNIRFRPDESLAVSAPPQIGRARVEDYLKQNAARMLGRCRDASQQQVTYARLSAAPEDGLLYFGEPVRAVTVTTSGREGVRYAAGMLIVSQKDPADTVRRGKLLDRFQETAVLEEMTAHCRDLYPLLAEYRRQMTENPGEPLPSNVKNSSGVTTHRRTVKAASRGGLSAMPLSFPDIRLEHARSVWGTCAAQQGVIRFSTALLGTSHAFCRYVAAHELCHLLHPDHSPAFWQAVTALCPDWKALRHSAPTIL